MKPGGVDIAEGGNSASGVTNYLVGFPYVVVAFQASEWNETCPVEYIQLVPYFGEGNLPNIVSRKTSV